MVERTCSVDDCTASVTVAGRCRRCYNREYARMRSAATGPRMFTCVVCGLEFPKRPKGGIQKYCSETCYRDVRLAQRREREYRPEQKQCARCGEPVPYKSGKRRFCSQACQVKDGTRRRRWIIKGLDPDAHGLKERCGICGSTKKLVIDHDHQCCPGEQSCGRCVRGFLCHRHNVAIGLFHEDLAQLRDAIAYIERHRQLKLAV